MAANLLLMNLLIGLKTIILPYSTYKPENLTKIAILKGLMALTEMRYLIDIFLIQLMKLEK